MKFLCDRCKTRYSIADERVRGKILKIRCKNCSNVITVREGMPEPEVESPQAAEARRAIRPTDYQPSVMGAAPAKAAPSPLRDAFAQALEKPAAPPPALEEEWYVSKDGNQEGPFSLTEAQEWVKGKRADDDLHCWCEGFDDWLPVEKVSHFRGLRVRKAPPKAPPRAPARSAPAREEEPKPLFAAALAALEQDVRTGPKTTPDGGNGEPAPAPTAPRQRRQTAGEMAIAEMRQSTPSPAAPLGKPALPSARAPLPAPNRSKPATIEPPSALAKATPLTGTPARADRPSRSMPAFDESESGGAAAPARIGLDALADEAGPNGHADAPVEDDNDFAIGEVSRVVRLQDVVAAGARKQQAAGKKTSAIPAARATATMQAMTEAATPASPLAEAAAASLTDDHGLHPDAVDEAPAAAVLAPVATRPKRGHLTLMAAGGAALVLIIGLVVFFASGGDDEEGGSRIGGAGGDVEGLAISVDDPRYPGLGKKVPDTAETPTTRKPSGGTRRPTGGGSQVTTGPTNGTVPGGKQEVVMGPDGPIEPLTADDVITQALKMSTGTQRCYSRALKDDPFLKVKSISALISISREGKVTAVSLDQMQTAPLGQCLVAAIKRWPFRKSTEGLETKITLKFEQTIGP